MTAMPPRTDIGIFLDLETTGSGDDEEIVEFGAVAVRLPSFEELSIFQTVVVPTPAAWNAMQPVVVAMHAKSGLTQDVVGGKGIRLADLDTVIVNWLETVVGKDTSHIPLGGSGVSHFDRKFIKRDTPRFDGRLTYWALDAGVLRRTFRMAGVKWLPGATDETKVHRALDDARLHTAEFKYALDVLAQIGGLVPTLKA